ncbi:uncharacterized protein LOC121110759 [Gallus gallus]|uniref:uncharacterized protein LOC121110759 n=1 Tax=Gallus gallus TaxID=9031 RepID=UPI001AE9F26B|nr:uncharacterized protein LOC121110759 [Gallus gallus]
MSCADFPPETKQQQTRSNSQRLLTTRIRSARRFPSRRIHSEQRRGLTPSPVDPCFANGHRKLFPAQIPLLRCRRRAAGAHLPALSVPHTLPGFASETENSQTNRTHLPKGDSPPALGYRLLLPLVCHLLTARHEKGPPKLLRDPFSLPPAHYIYTYTEINHQHPCSQMCSLSKLLSLSAALPTEQNAAPTCSPAAAGTIRGRRSRGAATLAHCPSGPAAK